MIHRRTGILTISISTDNTTDEFGYHADTLLRFSEQSIMFKNIVNGSALSFDMVFLVAFLAHNLASVSF